MTTKVRIGFILLLTFFMITSVRSQTAYYFQYKFTGSSDTNTYHAFFVRYADGSGFMRVRFDPAGSTEPFVDEMQLWQRPVLLNEEIMDSTKIRFDTTGPANLIFGSRKTVIPVPSFWFKLDPKTKNFETAGITATDRRGMFMQASILNQELYTAQTLDKDIVSQFFTASEHFYLDGPDTRGLTPEEKKTRLHLLIVANTNDPTVGKACALDMRRVIQTFDTITRFMNIRMDTVVIAGKNYNKANVEKAIKALNPDPNDIVVFYYTGHGFRKAEDNRDYPFIDLRPKDDRTYRVNSLNIEDIFNTIRNKPKAARLNLVLSDCCNNDPDAKKVPAWWISGFRDIRDWSLDNCRKLFLDPTPLSLLMTAAQKEQLASCDTTAGSLFTLFFKTALENNLSKLKTNVTWYRIADETKNATSLKARNTYVQRPFIEKNLGKQDPVKRILTGRGN